MTPLFFIMVIIHNMSIICSLLQRLHMPDSHYQCKQHSQWADNPPGSHSAWSQTHCLHAYPSYGVCNTIWHLDMARLNFWVILLLAHLTLLHILERLESLMAKNSLQLTVKIISLPVLKKHPKCSCRKYTLRGNHAGHDIRFLHI